MALFRTVDGVVLRFDNNGNPITDFGAPRPGPTIWEIGGPDGSSPDDAPPAAAPPAPAPPPAPTPAPPAAAGFARLFVDVTDQLQRRPFPGATVLSASTATGNQTHTTDVNGTAVLTAGVGEDIEVNVIADGYAGVDQLVHIYDASDHRLGVAIHPAGARVVVMPVPTVPPALPAPPVSGQPPGVPSEIVLQAGQLGELEAPTLHAGDVVPTPPYARAAVELRDGVPSITADSFSALDIGSAIPGPVGIFASIIGGLLGLFKGASGSADVGRLSTVVQNIGDLLLKTVSAVSDLAARSVHTDTQAAGLFSHLLGGVLGPIINALAAVIRGGSSDLGKLFGPVTDTLKKIIGAVKHVYDVWLRPIIKAIDTARQLLKILETFHVKWAAEADAALGRLEGKLTAPLLQTIQQLNKVSNFVNRIVTLDGTLQRVTLVASHIKHSECLNNVWWNSQASPPGANDGLTVTPAPDAMTGAGFADATKQFVDSGDGPFADGVSVFIAAVSA